MIRSLIGSVCSTVLPSASALSTIAACSNGNAIDSIDISKLEGRSGTVYGVDQ